MYKVFLNERMITVCHSANPTIIKDSVIVGNLHTVSEFVEWFRVFVASNTKYAVITEPDPEIFWNKIFVPSFTLIAAAGGVVIRNKKLLFIYRNEKWDLPKGKVESGETVAEAALREVGEECGISGHQIITTLPSTFHLFQSPYMETFGQWILKETHWFEMNYTGTENGTPQTKEHITKVKWFSKNEFDQVLVNTYENLKLVIDLY